MGDILSSIGSALGSITAPEAGLITGAVSGVANLIGGQNQQAASAQQVQQQEQFQENMSDTEFQRSVTDLEAAGLNPILAVGAQDSSPGGAAFQPQNVLGNAVGAGVSAAGSASSIALQESQRNKVDQDTDTSMSQQALLDAQRQKVMADTSASVTNATNLALQQPILRRQNEYLEDHPELLSTGAFMDQIGMHTGSALGLAGGLAGAAAYGSRSMDQGFMNDLTEDALLNSDL